MKSDADKFKDVVNIFEIVFVYGPNGVVGKGRRRSEAT